MLFDWKQQYEGKTQLKVSPITLYQSEGFDGSGSQIAACDVLISYAIKGGKIRVLNRKSAARTLLREHESTILDLAFAPVAGEVRYLASCAGNRAVVWELRAGIDGEEIPASLVASGEGATRVAWAPKGVVLGVASGQFVRAWTDGFTATKEGMHDGNVTDLRWSRELASASDDGSVRLWAVGSTCLECTAHLTPHGGEPVVALLSVRRMLLTASATELKLWRGKTLLQTSKNFAPTAPFRLAANDDFVVVGAGNTVLVAHLSDSALDRVTAFDVGQVVSSLCCLEAPVSAEAEDAEADAETFGYELHLFCVQTKAIQQFYVRPSTCYKRKREEAAAKDGGGDDDDEETKVRAETAVRAAAARTAEAATTALAARFDDDSRAWRDLATRVTALEANHNNNNNNKNVEATRDAAIDAFKDAFQKAVVPAVQAACRAMFSQLDAALQARLQRFEEIEAQRIDRLDAAIAAFLEDNKLGSAVSKQPETNNNDQRRPADIREQLRDLVKNDGDYDTAVYRAVEVSDVDVLLFALDLVGIHNVQPLQPTPFQQLTLLCVIQQLGTTLDNPDHAPHVSTKLDWIQLSLLSLDPANPQISSHVPEVLRQLQRTLDALPPDIKATHRNALAVLPHITNSLLNLI